MQSGYFSIRNVLEYATDHPYPAIPSSNNHKAVYNGYKGVFQPLLQQVPVIPGWYAWMKIGGRSLELIYLGKSGKGRTSDVRARLDEEFRDERIAIWATVDEKLRNSEPRGKYATEAKRSLRKAGVTHIIWWGQAGLDNEQVKGVECNLIKKFKPRANVQKGQCTDRYSELTVEAIDTFERVTEELKSKII